MPPDTTQTQNATGSNENVPYGLLKPNEALKRLILTETKNSLGKLAKKTGISKTHLSRFLNGHRTIGKEAIVKLEAAGIPISKLYGLCPTCGKKR